MADPNVPLSVLDLAPVGAGRRPRRRCAIRSSSCSEVERLGYRRHWVAEHHNMPGIASSSPAVLLAHLADATSTIRVGSGGAHAARTTRRSSVAEQFGMLEALHPGRIDLGIGRAPGTDPVTASALRRSSDALDRRRVPRSARPAARVLRRLVPGRPSVREHHRGARRAGTARRSGCSGSSTYSAHAAGVLGMPFSFAYHFAPAALMDALAAYRDAFRAVRRSRRART